MASTNTEAKRGGGCLVVLVICGIWLLLGIIGLAIETRGIALIPIAIICALILAYGKYDLRRTKERTARDQAVKNKSRVAREQLQQQAAAERRVIGSLTALDPYEFERTIGVLMAGIGYADVRHVGGSGDRGADLTAIDSHGRKIVVQCKRYAASNKVGSMEIQRFVGAITIHGASRGIVVTTSDFTPEARAIASNFRVDLIDGAKLRQWLEQYERNSKS